jgi:uncharacterized protein YndB with AHSA1/START domain
MKKILIGAFLFFDAILVGLVVLVMLQPDTMHVERSVQIEAGPQDVFPIVNDYAHWDAWNPWHEKDPDQLTEISTPSAGVGAHITWSGDENVGRGKMTITASVPNERVVQDLEFFEPWENKAVATIALKPTKKGTKVTWSFDSDKDVMGKAMGLVMDMDAMLGPDFKYGLNRLSKAASAAAANRLQAEATAEAAAKAAAEAAAEVAADAEPRSKSQRSRPHD